MKRNTLKKIITYLVLISASIIAITPFIYMVMLSTKTSLEVIQSPMALPNPEATLHNYGEVLFSKSGGYWKLIINSTIITSVAVLAAILLASHAAYAFSRFRFRGKKNIGFTILSFRFIPPLAIAIPFYLMMVRLHLLDTHIGVILPYIIMDLPFAFWMMMGFFQEIHKDIDDSAMVDGCSRLAAFWRILLPLAKPGLIATAIFCSILNWNEFLIALFIVSTTKAATVTVGASGILTAQRSIEWNIMSTVGVVLTIPILVFTFLVQKHLVRGLTLGAVKG